MANDNQTRRNFLKKGAAMGMGVTGTAVLSDAVLAQARLQQASDAWSNGKHVKSGEAPISIKSSTLVVNDLKKVGAFYQTVLGLDILRSDGETMQLGAGGRTLLILRKDVHARRHPTEAGLFHNAFLMPDRAALGRWLRHAAELRVRFTGFADHEVSEAVYLDDPEGNGIEVYADRTPDNWVFHKDGQLRMNTVQMDLHSVLSAADTLWNGAPEDMIIGHVHLQVGDIEELHGFMTQSLGQDLMVNEGSAAFYSSGGYHHHFAGNNWNSRSAGVRSPDSTGLAGVTLLSDQTRIKAGDVIDPWGNRFTVEVASDA